MSKARAVLLEDGFQPIGLSTWRTCAGAQISADSPDEFRILCVKDAGGGEDHAAATSASNRTSGRKNMERVPSIQLALDLDLPAVFLHDAVHDRQPKPVP